MKINDRNRLEFETTGRVFLDRYNPLAVCLSDDNKKLIIDDHDEEARIYHPDTWHGFDEEQFPEIASEVITPEEKRELAEFMIIKWAIFARLNINVLIKADEI